MTNAGQANAATGDQGYKDAVETAECLAKALGIKSDDILLQSTGSYSCIASRCSTSYDILHQ
jgi:glutamate N-acetyltransferase/amino-acid N-acetyltransferase